LGFLDPFKNEGKCGRCQIVFSKKEIHYFDSSFRGRRKHGEKLMLCSSCFVEEISKYFKNYEAMAIAVYPLKELNAYHFYTFIEMKQYHFPQEFIEGLKGLMSISHPRQCLCGVPAHFVWCSPEIYNKDPLSPKLKIADQFQRQYLCGRCLASDFTRKIIDEDIHFDDFLPPVDSDGFCTSFET